jgi:nucleotide-binding universal stress UspA family protein
LFRRIVVCYDGSDHSKKALEIAVDLAKRYGAEIIVITVVDIASSTDPSVIKIAEDAAGQISSEASEKLSKEGIEHSSINRHGDPGVEIVKAAEENKADLIVVGSSGLSTLRRLILGSVSRKVINKSRIPVLVVE